MPRYMNHIIAQETIKITEQKWYMCKRRRVGLPLIDYSEVEVFSPERLLGIENIFNNNFKKASSNISSSKYYVLNADSFEAAKGLERVLVMNFANAHVPGGGFLSGAKAQEESLCRCSTLYKSISSSKAKEMYDYNNSTMNPLASDYMLLSPNVCVFRTVTGRLLENPYNVSVVTVPAPNRNGEACYISDDEIVVCMKNRLKIMVYMAAVFGYRNLILGAWGCGAFGNNTKDLVNIYEQIFKKEGLENNFEKIIFAIYNDPEKMRIFEEKFGV